MPLEQGTIFLQVVKINDMLLQPGMFQFKLAPSKTDDFPVSRVPKQLQETLIAHQAGSAEKQGCLMMLTDLQIK